MTTTTRLTPAPPTPAAPETMTVRRKLTGFPHITTGDYVREWWLPILGPTTTVLLQLLARTTDPFDGDIVLSKTELACRVGCQATGKQSPFTRSLGRLVYYANVTLDDAGTYEIPTRMRALDGRDLDRMTPAMRAQHHALYGGGR